MRKLQLDWLAEANNLVAVILVIIIIVLVCDLKEAWVLFHQTSASVLESRFEAPAAGVTRFRSSSRPSPPLWTQLIIIIIQVAVLFSPSLCFKVFTVIAALPGVDRLSLSLSVLISSAVLSTARGKASPWLQYAIKKISCFPHTAKHSEGFAT